MIHKLQFYWDKFLEFYGYYTIGFWVIFIIIGLFIAGIFKAGWMLWVISKRINKVEKEWNKEGDSEG